MINLNPLAFVPDLLPFGVFMSFPLLLVEAHTATQQIAQQAPTSPLEYQGWIIAVVGAAMGIVRIMMWLRGKDTEADKAVVSLLENQAKIIERLAENQTKLLEVANLLKVMMLNQESTIKAYIDFKATTTVSDVKEALRELQ